MRLGVNNESVLALYYVSMDAQLNFNSVMHITCGGARLISFSSRFGDIAKLIDPSSRASREADGI
jgi:hypothetical protein